jgi:PAS domain S-box-containing protein
MKTNKAERRLGSVPTTGLECWLSFADKLDEIVLVWDKKGRLLICNRRATELLGYSRAELLELQSKQILPDEYKKWDYFFNKAHADKEVNIKTTCVKKQGVTVPASVCFLKLSYQGKAALITIIRCLSVEQDGKNLLAGYVKILTKQNYCTIIKFPPIHSRPLPYASPVYGGEDKRGLTLGKDKRWSYGKLT